LSWSNPDNVPSSDNAYASANVGCATDQSHYLKASNFGFSLPAGAIILGIVVEIERSQSGTSCP